MKKASDVKVGDIYVFHGKDREVTDVQRSDKNTIFTCEGVGASKPIPNETGLPNLK